MNINNFKFSTFFTCLMFAFLWQCCNETPSKEINRTTQHKAKILQDTLFADSLFKFFDKQANFSNNQLLLLDTMLSCRQKAYELLPTKGNHIKIARSYYTIGLYHHNFWNYFKAQQYYKRGLEIVQKYDDITRVISYSLALANTITDCNDNVNADILIDNALKLIKSENFKKNEKYTEYLLKAFLYKSNIAHKQENYIKAFQLDSISNVIYLENKKSRKENDYIGNIHNLGIDYSKKKQFDLAFSYFNISCRGYQKFFQSEKDDKYLLNIANTTTEIAHTHFAIKNYPQAIKNYQTALEYLDKAQAQIHPYRAEALTGIGNCYFEQKKYSAAFDACDKAKKALVPDDKLENLRAPNQYLPAALAKLKTRKALNTNDLQAILADCQYIDNLINFIQKQYSNDESKLDLTEKSLPFYEDAIESAVKSYQKMQSPADLNLALTFCERNKAIILRQNLKEQNALQYSDIPKGSIEKERNLKIELAYYKEQAFDNQSDMTAKKKAIDVQRQLDSLIDSFKNEFPRYYDLKYNNKASFSIDEIQSQLPANTMVIEYFMGEKNIYTFAISKQHTAIEMLPIPSNFDSTFDDFRTAIEGTENEKAFCNASHQLYKWLISSTLAKAPSNITSLRIIPDGKLGYIPFDVLAEQPLQSWKYSDKTAWLLRKYAISYTYSNTLLFKRENQEQIGNKISVGFGIDYKDSHLHQQLLEAPEEVKKVMNAFGGKSFLNENATIDNFEKNASNSKILYLAMHGILNEDNPLRSGLIFSSKGKYDTLYAHDIYNKQLQNGLAVLSACNTGNGELRRGEGVMSLGRAFAYAGTPSLVMSLWKISDISTGEVMDLFQANLQKGMSKDSALQQAKLRYLDKSSSSGTLPNLWAASTLVGDISPLPTETHWIRNVLIVLGLCIFLFFLSLQIRAHYS